MQRAAALASKQAYVGSRNEPGSRPVTIPGWKRRSDLSDEETTVFVDQNDKNVIVAFAGTHRFKDLSPDYKIINGEGLYDDRRFRQATSKTSDIVKRYGKNNVTVTGHSLGGRIALEVGKELDIPSISFNPGISLRDYYYNVKQDVAKNRDSYRKATIYVHPLDIISTTSQMIPGATIKRTDATNDLGNLAKDMATTAVGSRVMKPFDHLQPRVNGINVGYGVGVFNTGVKFLQHAIGWHSLSQYQPQMEISSGGTTIRSSLGRTQYPTLKPEDFGVQTKIPKPSSTFENAFASALSKKNLQPSLTYNPPQLTGITATQ